MPFTSTNPSSAAHTTPTPSRSAWSIDLVNVLAHGDPMIERTAAPITCILPLERSVYTGDEDGRIVSDHSRETGCNIRLTKSSTSGTVCSDSIERRYQKFHLVIASLHGLESRCVHRKGKGSNMVSLSVWQDAGVYTDQKNSLLAFRFETGLAS